YGASWTATVDYGDGSGVQPLILNPNKTFTLNHAYAAPAGNSVATVTVVNNEGSYDTEPVMVSVVAPIQVANVAVNGGGAQRSRVQSLVVNFSLPVAAIDPGAFSVTGPGGAVAY